MMWLRTLALVELWNEKTYTNTTHARTNTNIFELQLPPIQPSNEFVSTFCHFILLRCGYVGLLRSRLCYIYDYFFFRVVCFEFHCTSSGLVQIGSQHQHQHHTIQFYRTFEYFYAPSTLSHNHFLSSLDHSLTLSLNRFFLSLFRLHTHTHTRTIQINILEFIKRFYWSDCENNIETERKKTENTLMLQRLPKKPKNVDSFTYLAEIEKCVVWKAFAWWQFGNELAIE